MSMALEPGLALPVEACPAAAPALRVLHVLPALAGGGMERAAIRLIAGAARWSRSDGCVGPICHGLCILKGAEPSLLGECRSKARIWVLGQGGTTGGPARLAGWWRLRRVIRAFRPHVVHARSTGTWFDAAAATRGLPDVRLLLSYHGQTDLAAPAWRRRAVDRWSSARAAKVVAVCESARAALVGGGVRAAEKVVVLRNGVDTARFRPPLNLEERSSLRRGFALTDRDQVVLCVANLVPIKAIDILLRAWRRVCLADRSGRLLLVGEGPLEAELRGLAAELRCDGCVQFLGRRDDVAELMRAADLFVLPSRQEACSNALLEAMASGLAPVACRVGGNTELITPGQTGWLVPPDEPEQLAGSLLAALVDPAQRQAMGRTARDTVERDFGLQAWVRAYACLYRDLAAADARFRARMEPVPCAE